jgi:hypothetical protein
LNQYTEVAGVNTTYDDAGNMTNDGDYEYVYDAGETRDSGAVEKATDSQ